MEQNNIQKIIFQFLCGRFPPDLEERVQKWIIKDKDSQEKEQASFDYWNELNSEADASTYSAWERVNKRIGYAGRRKISLLPYRKLARIAAMLIPVCLFVSGYFYYHTIENRLTEVSTAYGETKYLLLPDSSEVWLNAGTTLRYSKAFAEESRLVLLDGEAYFSVRKDTENPFIVRAKQLSVEVLGTEFNVKAYLNDERMITALTSGKVKIEAEDKKTWILIPNQQLSYANQGTSVEITELSSEETRAWVNGQLIFIRSPFNEIVKTIERHFNVRITSQMDISSSKQYTVKFLKNENLDDVLSVLGEVIGFTYWQKENEVVWSAIE